jgi:hypothetical protein
MKFPDIRTTMILSLIILKTIFNSLWISWFLDFVHHPVLWKTRKHYFSKGLTRVGVSSSFWNIVFSRFLEYWTMGKVQKPSDSECYTPSSEPFRIYQFSIKFYSLFLCTKSTAAEANSTVCTIKQISWRIWKFTVTLNVTKYYNYLLTKLTRRVLLKKWHNDFIVTFYLWLRWKRSIKGNEVLNGIFKPPISKSRGTNNKLL